MLYAPYNYYVCSQIKGKRAGPCRYFCISGRLKRDPGQKEDNDQDAQDHFQNTGTHGDHGFTHTLQSASKDKQSVQSKKHTAAYPQKLRCECDGLRSI